MLNERGRLKTVSTDHSGSLAVQVSREMSGSWEELWDKREQWEKL